MVMPVLAPLWRERRLEGIKDSFLPVILSAGRCVFQPKYQARKMRRTYGLLRQEKRNQNAECVARRRKDEERKVVK